MAIDERLSAELQQLHDQQSTVTLWMYGHEAFTLILLIQAACRDDAVGSYARQVGETLVRQLAASLPVDGAIGEAIREGRKE